MKSIFNIFLRSYVFIALLIGMSQIFSNDYSDIVWGRNIFLPALLFTVMMVLIHIIFASYSGVRGDFSSYQFETIDGQVDLKILALEISKKTKWILEEENSSRLRYRSGFTSIKSFGESIIIEKEENQIRIASKPLLRSTLFDYGKNFQNVKTIKNLISSLQFTTAI